MEVYSEFAGYKDTDKETGTDGGTGTETTGKRLLGRVMEGDQRAHTMNYKEWVTRMMGICWWIRRQCNEAVFRGDSTDRATTQVLERKLVQETSLWIKY